MKNNLLVLFYLGLSLCVGCGSHRPSPWKVEREKKKALKRTQEMMEMMKPQIEQIHKIVAEYKTIGVAAVKMTPAGAQLYVDGGQYVEGSEEITLPVGPHQFKAVWPDGATTTRDIYIVTALTGMELKFDYNEGDYNLNMGWHTESPELHKTPVVLTKPD
jgi:hypothetical protein